jgi:L-aminopeptidase/D-esterase-like protein
MTSMITTDAQLVREYFRRIAENAESALQLFTDDAIVYEPFSIESCLMGKSQIVHFLRIAQMANSGLGKKIGMTSDGKSGVEVLVEFTREGTVSGRFLFKTQEVQTNAGVEKKIKELKIQFAN